ncbi:SPOR domain-containing protein [Allochromatium palmeri]|uniref:SPOR domain-containing protein n=1 Tax=Allochromatium palmeri TaxID=231048 RepID=A0A6N8EGA8_9GAMM|nr:SPOR domain-containing protein [Allochromatium palmeri]MTW22580.1 hypothetical protein [Allochromatium palmeri]
MTRDNTQAQCLMALALIVGAPLTAVEADAGQPLPRAPSESASDARWLEHLPSATQPLPRSIDLAQSGSSSLEDALKLLESRVESGALDTAPSRVESPPPVPADERRRETPVSAPPPPVAPAPPVVPAPPVAPEPIEPVSPSADAIDAAPEKPPLAPVAPSDAPNPDEPTAEAAPPLEAPPETTPEPVDARITANTPEPAAPPATTGRWQVQLLAGRSLARVERDRDDIQRFHGDSVAGLTLAISQARPGGLYRLRALDWTSQAAAGDWCQRLRAATRLECMVVRGDDPPASASMDAPPPPAR